LINEGIVFAMVLKSSTNFFGTTLTVKAFPNPEELLFIYFF